MSDVRQCLDCGQLVELCEPHANVICDACWETRLLEAAPNEVLYCIDCDKRCEFLPGDDEAEADSFPFTICDDCSDKRALKAGYVWDENDKQYVKKEARSPSS